MAADVGVLIVPGMGSPDPDLGESFVNELANRIKRNKVDPERIAFETVQWQHVLYDRENALYARMKESHKLRYDDLRRFILSAFGDAVAYQRTGNTGQDTYGRIHKEVHERLRLLHHRLEGDKPLVALGHGLGSVVLSNYIWDEQTGRGYGNNPFTRFETLAGLVTFGSTIPLFTLPLDKPAPIAFPPSGLPEALRRSAKWLNFYDPDDVLGWPLKSVNEKYNEVVTEDRPIEVGTFLQSFTPLSHQHYWTDEDFVWPVAKLIAEVANAARGVA